MSEGKDGQMSPALTEASAILLQAGILSTTAEQISMDRSISGRSASGEEIALERRIDESRGSMLSAVAVAREIAVSQPSLVNSGVARMLEDPLLVSGFRDRFDSLIGVSNGDYAKLVLAISDQVESQSRPVDSGNEEIPPVSGGNVTGCDLIALGSMLGGATCVVGCAPCCVVGAGGALIYVGVCT